jgi:phasin family protein
MAKSAQSKQIEDALSPVVAYNKLVIEASEKALALHVASVQKLAKIGFDNWNAVFNIKSADDVKVYAEKQQVVAKEVAEIVTVDVREIGELNQHFLEDSRKLAEDNIKVATTKAA